MIAITFIVSNMTTKEKSKTETFYYPESDLSILDHLIQVNINLISSNSVGGIRVFALVERSS